MGKILKWIFGILGILLLLVIATVVVIAILLYDNTNGMNQDIIDANKSTTEVISDMNYNALETSGDDKLSYTFGEYKMNELIYSLTKDLKLDPIEIKGVYTEYLDDGTFTVNLPAKVYFFSTLLSAKLEVKDNTDSITLVVKDLKVGKISSTNFLVKSIMTKALNAETIQNTLNSSSPIPMEVTYEDNVLSCTIKDADFFSLVKKSIGDSNDLYSTLIDVVASNPNLFSVSFDGESKGIVINLKELETDIADKYKLETKLNVNEKVIAQVEALTATTLGTDDATVLTNYLLKGYLNLKDDEQTTIDNLDLSSLTVTDYNGLTITLDSNLKKIAWLGMLPHDSTTLAQVIADQEVTLSHEHPDADVKLTDDNINATMDDQSFIGTTFNFYNSEKKINYVTVSNGYVICHDNQLMLFVVLDLNGKEVQAEIKLDTPEENQNYTVVGTLNEIHIGNIVCSNDQAFSILDYVANIVDIDGFISLNSSEKTVTLNFREYFLADARIAALPESNITSVMTIEEGYINVHYTLTA